MHQPPVADQAIRRLTAAIPEFGLALACYRSAQATLDGESTDFFIIGLVAVEMISLALLRLIVAPETRDDDRSILQRLLSFGATGISMFFLFANGIMMVMFLLILLFVEPAAFVFLMIAGGRRFLWRWSWYADSTDREELNAQVRRTYHAHWLACLMAGLISVALNLLVFGNVEAGQQTTDALFMAAAAGYFASLGIYLLAGKVSLPELPDEAELLSIAKVQRPAPGQLLNLAFARWHTLLPGAALLFLVLSLFTSVADPDAAMVLMPVAIGAGSWLLMANAASLFRQHDASDFMFGLARARAVVLGCCTLLTISFFLFLISVPVVFSITGVEFSADPLPAVVYAGFVVVVLAICFLLIRLWPAITLPFLTDADTVEPVIPDRLKNAWQMTSGIDGFMYGAMPPVVPMLLIGVLLSLPEPMLTVGLFVIFLVLAPVTVVIAIERTAHMAAVRLESAGETASPQYTDSQDSSTVSPVPDPAPRNPDIPIPVMLPVPTDKGEIRSRPVSPPNPTRETISRADEKSGSSDRVDHTPETLLISAVYDGDLVTIDQLITDGTSVNTIKDGESLLLIALRMGRPGAVTLLIDHGADLNLTGISGSTPLHYAASSPDMLDFVTLFLSRGIDINSTNDRGETPIKRALASDNLATFEFLREQGADVLAIDDRGNNLLNHLVNGRYGLNRDRRKRGHLKQGGTDADFSASERRYLEPIKSLLNAGVDPLRSGEYGRHAASLAGQRNLTEVLTLFQQEEVDLSVKDASNQSALGAAAMAGQQAAVEQLEQLVEMDFITAVATGRARLVETALLEDPTLINATSGGSRPYSALNWAVQHGHLEITQMLLAAGADVNVQPALQGSILHLAVRHLSDVVPELIELGADLDAIDGDMNTPLNFAARDNNLVAARLLLEAGADPTLSTERGYRPKLFATSDAMKQLLQDYEKKWDAKTD